MSREWKVGDRVRDTVRMRDGVVVAARSDAIDVKLGNSVFTWVFPIGSLVHLEQNQSEEARVFPHTKVEVGGETVFDTTAKRSLVITDEVHECLIHDPCDDSGVDDLRVRKVGIEVRVERRSSDEEMSFDIEELELLLEAAKKLLQKE